MDCKKAQRLFDDLAHERLVPETAAHVRRHLAECTDCRVLEQRGARLQRLLALKRYERPAPEYFDNFHSEFHSRLLAEAQHTGWWEQALGRIENLLAIGSLRMWRYSVASAVGVAAVVGLMWTSASVGRFRQPGRRRPVAGCGGNDAAPATFHAECHCRVTHRLVARVFVRLPALDGWQCGLGSDADACGFSRASLRVGSHRRHPCQL